MASSQKTSNRTGTQKRLERLLGMSERNNPTFLPMRLTFSRRPTSGNGTETSNNRRRCYYATHPGTSETGLYFLPKHSVRWCLLIPGAVSGKIWDMLWYYSISKYRTFSAYNFYIIVKSFVGSFWIWFFEFFPQKLRWGSPYAFRFYRL